MGLEHVACRKASPCSLLAWEGHRGARAAEGPVGRGPAAQGAGGGAARGPAGGAGAQGGGAAGAAGAGAEGRCSGRGKRACEGLEGLVSGGEEDRVSKIAYDIIL